MDIESSVTMDLIDPGGIERKYRGVGQATGTTYWIGGDDVADLYSESLKEALRQVKEKARADDIILTSSGDEVIVTDKSATVQEVIAEYRIALVIGNASYEGLGALDNPLNDARDVSSALARLGFGVSTVLDGTQQQIEEAVQLFARNLQEAQVGLFYYAGHGTQHQGHNYLIPIDANIQTAADLKYKAVQVDFILDHMSEAGNPLKIVVLDACRDNPFLGTRGYARGLAVISSPPEASVIVYATAPGSTASDGDGRNSPFTMAFLKHLETPGLELHDFLGRVGVEVSAATRATQRPWIATDFYGRFYFAGASTQ